MPEKPTPRDLPVDDTALEQLSADAVAMRKIVTALKPLPPERRAPVVRAVMALLNLQPNGS